ncbi:unnamed protein product [Rotaria sordida]|uniref:Uncharacterized protein n=1 Tax=Rotaria sordida TaxID=392033 RepID=A0A814ZPI5_9BILA|nr:unnamed protein product [Rotaria sordida]
MLHLHQGAWTIFFSHTRFLTLHDYFYSSPASQVTTTTPFTKEIPTCSAQSSLIAFDDIISTTSISGVLVPNGYNRLNWQNVLVVNGINYYTPNTGYTTGVVSPPYLIFNGYGNPMAITNMATTCSAQSSLITFDDIISTTSISGVPVPNGYNRLNWQNVLVVNGINYYTPNTGYTTGVVSPPYLAFNGYGNPMAITNMATSAFTINSFYSCAAWHDNTILTMTGTRSGAVLYTKKVT